MRAVGAVLWFCAMVNWCGPAAAHPPSGHGDHTRGDAEEQAEPAMILPQIAGTGRPWSDQPVLSDPRRFQFAVMSDNTGGHRPGVWMHGVRNLNLLRPEFVVSIGDLIEGGSEDEQQVESEWDEFQGFIRQLDMKFFFVAGNHDVSNPVMHRIWRKHFGAEWYSFDYQGVHFVCLCSEDPDATLGEQQLQWLGTDLREHSQARWTFVFLHKPLWAYSEKALHVGNPDTTQWQQVAAWLKDRPHTVFAGHIHQYVQYARNGTHYYQLGTTGGSSRLRGAAYGEFDHVTWVTMESDGPHIANVLLDGVLAPDVVTEGSIVRFRRFLSDVQLGVTPLLIVPGEDLRSGTIAVQLANRFDQPVSVSVRLLGIPLKGLTLEPEQTVVEVPPDGVTVTAINYGFSHPLPEHFFRHVTIMASIRSVEDAPLSAELTVPVPVDRNYPCQDLDISVDGELGEWRGEPLAFSEQPQIFGNADQWKGIRDGSLRFRVAYHGPWLFLAGEVLDDRVIADQDRVLFGFDARSSADRQKDPRLGEHGYVVELTPSVEPRTGKVKVTPRWEGSVPEIEAHVICHATSTGYRFEAQFPVSVLTEAQGPGWDGFQMNAILRDVDEPQEDAIHVMWRPALDIQDRNTNYGYFYRSAVPIGAGR